MKNQDRPITRDDVLKIIAANGGITSGIDLSNRNMAGIDLSGLDLRGIDFRDSNFRPVGGSTTEPAARFDSSNLEGCRLDGATFFTAYMKSTNLSGTSAKKADFTFADLTDADFSSANLQSARFAYSNLDKTVFKLASLDGAFFRDAKLETAYFTQAEWGDKYRLGDEEESYVWAEQTYKALKQRHRTSLLDDIAGEFRYRELWSRKRGQNERLRASIKNHSPRAIVSTLSRVIPLTVADVLFGFGERWKRVVLWWFIIVGSFALAYFIWSVTVQPVFPGHTTIEEYALYSFYYSIASFSALGYGSWVLEPIGWAKYAGLAEAILGPIMIALFITTFTRIWSR